MAIQTGELIESVDLYDLIVTAVKKICCNIDTDADVSKFQNEENVKRFRIQRKRQLDTARSPKYFRHHEKQKKDKERSSKYRKMSSISCYAYIDQVGIDVPAKVTESNVKTAVALFFSKSINIFLKNNTIAASQYYRINECIKKFIDDTIVCCISPIHNASGFFFEYDETKTYQYNVIPTVTSYLDSRLTQFYSKPTIEFINLAFANTSNLRVCKYKTFIDEIHETNNKITKTKVEITSQMQ